MPLNVPALAYKSIPYAAKSAALFEWSLCSWVMRQPHILSIYLKYPSMILIFGSPASISKAAEPS